MPYFYAIRETNLEPAVLDSVPIQVKILKIANPFVFQTYCTKGKATSQTTCLHVGDTKPKDHVLFSVKLASHRSFSIIAQLTSSLQLRYYDPLQFFLPLVQPPETRQVTRLIFISLSEKTTL